ncbi:MAG: endonuclease/exonuclease/phosphatase family protein [bacterium]|nr:MAG: endonuclease/exonuclease/phosphatase family protein [bacterium]
MEIRVATFNLENFDVSEETPTLEQRISIMRPQIKRLNADILCMQEVNSQEGEGGNRLLQALEELFQGTIYSTYNITCTTTKEGKYCEERNLVIASKYNISESNQINNELINAPYYRSITAIPSEAEAKPIIWDRPILYTKIEADENLLLHVINLHLKSRIPTEIPGQKVTGYKWASNPGWAEGYFISSMKRVGQALETRLLIDQIFDEDNEAKIIVCGDFNAHPLEVPVEAIAGRVENTGNGDLTTRVMISCENTIPMSSRHSYIHQGQKRLLDHMLFSNSLLPGFKFAEIHNETLHDESIAYATDTKFPESDHAPFVALFDI